MRAIVTILERTPRGGEHNVATLNSYFPEIPRGDFNSIIADMEELGQIETYQIEGRPLVVTLPTSHVLSNA